MKQRRIEKSVAKEPSETATHILDLAERLIQTRSYSAFSYQYISDALGIRKASIHYHFPSKAELGVAVVDRYIERFGAQLAKLSRDPSSSSMALLDHYIKPYMGFASTPDCVCVCGALAGEMMALPPPMRERVDHFFKTHHAWLKGILERGVERGEFRLVAPPAKTARMILGALQGALLVKRTTGDTSQMKDVVAVLKAQLAPSQTPASLSA